MRWVLHRGSRPPDPCIQQLWGDGKTRTHLYPPRGADVQSAQSSLACTDTGNQIVVCFFIVVMNKVLGVPRGSRSSSPGAPGQQWSVRWAHQGPAGGPSRVCRETGFPCHLVAIMGANIIFHIDKSPSLA